MRQRLSPQRPWWRQVCTTSCVLATHTCIAKPRSIDDALLKLTRLGWRCCCCWYFRRWCCHSFYTQTLTSQLNVSNPVLTAISDAMTAEGEAMVKLESAAPVSNHLLLVSEQHVDRGGLLLPVLISEQCPSYRCGRCTARYWSTGFGRGGGTSRGSGAMADCERSGQCRAAGHLGRLQGQNGRDQDGCQLRSQG